MRVRIIGPIMARLLEHTLCEANADSIDEEAGTIRNVKVLGRESKRGRTYSDAALRDACRLYEGIRVNFDHPDESNPAIVRGFFDQIGQLRNCKLGTDGVYADLDYLKSHPGAPILLESARRFPKLIGLSHNADGDKKRDTAGRVIVESIREVRSVDLVTRAATNNGLFESEGDEDDMPKTIKLRKLLESAKPSDRKKRLTALLEMDPTMGEMEVAEPVPAESADDAIKNALIQAAQEVVAKIVNGELDKAEGLKKLKDLLGMAEKATGEEPPPASGDGGESSSDSGGDSEATESLKTALADLRRQLTESERRQTTADCKNLLLESGREAKPEWIKALTAVQEADRKALLESLPKSSAPSGGARRPDRSPSILESEGETKLAETKEDFLKRLRGG